MKASLLLVCTLAGLALSGSMQTMSDSAIAEPLRLLLEVTKRSRELAYDLEKQVASSLNDGRMLASGLEGELARLVAATSNLTALSSVVGPEESLPIWSLKWTGFVAILVGLVTGLLNLIASFCLVRSLLYLRDERKRLAYTRSRLEESWTALGLTTSRDSSNIIAAGANVNHVLRGSARS